MKLLKCILINLSAILIVAPCILIVCEGNTILPNIIGFAYAFMIYKLSFTKIGRKFVMIIMRCNNYISKKI